MPWFKVDDGFSTSDKIIAIPRADRLVSIGLWTYAGNYAAKHLTNGFVPVYLLDDIDAPQEAIDHLVRVGLWDVDENGGFWFHDWCDYQPSAEAHKAKLEARSLAGRAGGLKSAEAKAKQTSSKTQAKVNPEPEPEPEPFTSSEVNTYGDLAFDEFWAFYPRKIGKGGAKKTWQKITRTVKPDQIIEGARRMSQDPNLPETQFIPHPSTWLNEGRWEDEPYAPRTQANAKQVQQNTARTEFLNSFSQQQELTQNPDWA